MAIVETVQFVDAHKRHRVVDLLHADRRKSGEHETTIITGQNGSQKSYLLKELVSMFVSTSERDLLSGLEPKKSNPKSHSVVCVSGSIADRFPQKDLPGGRRSRFDVPHYAYVGQRVGNNLLSRKAPLETMLGFALKPTVQERYDWNFFADAHNFAGVQSASVYRLAARGLKRELEPLLRDLRGVVANVSPESDDFGKRPFPNVSHATAQSLLSQFSAEDFDVLSRMVAARRRYDVHLSTQGAQSEGMSAEALRLGLLLGILRLDDVRVFSKHTGAEFSALELSSGEYHMLTTILATGFCLEDTSTLLMDEPENSLHPQWQKDLMATVLQTCSQVMKVEGHVIVCTHSPLVLGSSPEGSSVVDMTYEQPLLSTVSYGASSDELLLSQFGVGSSRNPFVVDVVQRAVSFIERSDFDSPEFLELIPELAAVRDALTASDPMVDVIQSILGEEKQR